MVWHNVSNRFPVRQAYLQKRNTNNFKNFFHYFYINVSLKSKSKENLPKFKIISTILITFFIKIRKYM